MFFRNFMDRTPMADNFSQSDLAAYLDEALPAEEMVQIEEALRKDPELFRQMSTIQSRRGEGLHSLGEIWRHHRLSCPTRQQLGSFRLKALTSEMAAYIAFHLEVVGCVYCRANLADLDSQQAQQGKSTPTRRRRFFETSASYLHGRE